MTKPPFNRKEADELQAELNKVSREELAFARMGQSIQGIPKPNSGGRGVPRYNIRGRPNPKVAAALKGQHLTEEHKHNISEGMTGKKFAYKPRDMTTNMRPCMCNGTKYPSRVAARRDHGQGKYGANPQNPNFWYIETT